MLLGCSRVNGHALEYLLKNTAATTTLHSVINGTIGTYCLLSYNAPLYFRMNEELEPKILKQSLSLREKALADRKFVINVAVGTLVNPIMCT